MSSVGRGLGAVGLAEGCSNIDGDAQRAAADRPLVTMAVLAFNQERYIGAAVRAALAQTYTPLQILLSDDSSSDATFRVMSEIASRYDGEHQIVLNRNKRNLGVAAHLNRIAELAGGSIIVLAAGDDISRPNRVELIASEFARSATVRAVYSGHTLMDSSGKTIRDSVLPADASFFSNPEVMAVSGGWVGLGATFAYHRDCFTTPQPLPSGILLEDGVLPFRAVLLGTIAHVPDPLVLYRKHEGAATAVRSFDTAEYRALHLDTVTHDLQWAARSGILNPMTHRRIQRALHQWSKYCSRATLFRRSRLLTKINTVHYYGKLWWSRRLIRVAAMLKIGAGRNSRAG
jgi:glycosyltransferase involved in cell wall biosynthesis